MKGAVSKPKLPIPFARPKPRDLITVGKSSGVYMNKTWYEAAHSRKAVMTSTHLSHFNSAVGKTAISNAWMAILA